MHPSALTELVADICAESGLDESEFNERLTLKILVQRIGTTKLEANVIVDYEKRLKETEWRIMVRILSRLFRPLISRPVLYDDLRHYLSKRFERRRRTEAAGIQATAATS